MLASIHKDKKLYNISLLSDCHTVSHSTSSTGLPKPGSPSLSLSLSLSLSRLLSLSPPQNGKYRFPDSLCSSFLVCVDYKSPDEITEAILPV